MFTRAATGSCPQPDKSNRQIIAVLVLKRDSVVITSNATADTSSFYVLKTSAMLQGYNFESKIRIAVKHKSMKVGSR
jgi:hypothetical protein